MIYHIYWGTSGSSGLYTDEIYKSLEREGYIQRVFVNYYYPFDYGDKIFFKRGDIANSKYKGVFRKLFQLQEVLFGFLKILFCVYRQNPKVVNFSHVGSSYFFTYWFLKAIKKVARIKLVVTCHDVMPLTVGSANNGEMKYRRKIFYAADKIIVHNMNSIKELETIFDINPNKVLFHPFPLMDLTKLTPKLENKYESVDFLFIGYLRKSKGIEFLLDSWLDFYKNYPTAKLRVCGTKPSDVNFDKTLLEANGVEFNLEFINDSDYYQYVKSTRYVILPYLKGTNSGIISTVLSLGADVITSDLPMFAENPMVNNDDMFLVGDKESLINKLEEKFFCQKNSSEKKIVTYRNIFDRKIYEVYKELYEN